MVFSEDRGLRTEDFHPIRCDAKERGPGMARATRLTRRTPPQQTENTSRAEDGPHVIVVDDDPDILNVVVLLLRGDGFRVSPASLSEEAVATMNAEPIHLLITDLRLANDDGIEVIRHAAQVTPDRPAVILLTAARAPEEASVSQLLDSVQATVVQKPFDIDYLLDLARRLTGWHGSL